MKVLGGIKGIASKPSNLDTHFLIIPEMNNIIERADLVKGIGLEKL